MVGARLRTALVSVLAIVAALLVVVGTEGSAAAAAVTFGPPVAVAYGLGIPEGVAVDAMGNVYVADDIAGR